jgi:hypothetical protein
MRFISRNCTTGQERMFWNFLPVLNKKGPQSKNTLLSKSILEMKEKCIFPEKQKSLEHKLVYFLQNHYIINGSPKLICMVASREKLTLQEREGDTDSAKDIHASESICSRDWPGPQCVLMVRLSKRYSCIRKHLFQGLAWSSLCPDGPCRDVFVRLNTEVPSLCVLHTNTWLCPLQSGSSAAGWTGSWMYL